MPNAKNRGLYAFLGGHSLSAVGSRMQTAALLWHAYELTASPFVLGSLALAEWLPLFLLSLFGGDVADRFDRRKVIAIAQGVQFLPAVVLAWMTSHDAVPTWVLFAVSAAGSAGQAFDVAARKALVPQYAGREGLARAMSLMDLAKNVAKLLGPALMGILAGSLGLAFVYGVNGLTFIVMGAIVLALPGTPEGERGGGSPNPPFLERVAEGFAFLKEANTVRNLIWLDFFATFCAGAESLLPIVAKELLNLGVEGYGILASGAAVGALVAGFGLVIWPPGQRFGRVTLLASLGFGAATIGFGFASGFWSAYVALMALGAMDTVSTVLRNTCIQLQTPDALRGRVTSIAQLFTKSGPRLGQFEAGWVAGVMGVQFSIVSGGFLAILATGWVLWRCPALWTSGASGPESLEP